jgi:hypothetical protein
MILFLGDSFTWGQGLQIPYWIQQGKSIDECNRLMPPQYPAEIYDYHADEYRKKHHFPNLVAKHFNKSYSTKWGNGGSNEDIIFHLKNVGKMMDIHGIDFIVIQFTEIGRDEELRKLLNPDFNSDFINQNPDKLIKKYIQNQIHFIDDWCTNALKKPWFAYSWRVEHGEILESEYPNNYIPLIYGDNFYNNQDSIHGNSPIILGNTIEGCQDGHLSEFGHEIVANSIIKKIENSNIY